MDMIKPTLPLWAVLRTGVDWVEYETPVPGTEQELSEWQLFS